MAAKYAAATATAAAAAPTAAAATAATAATAASSLHWAATHLGRVVRRRRRPAVAAAGEAQRPAPQRPLQLQARQVVLRRTIAVTRT